jgi:hypothetical protein
VGLHALLALALTSCLGGEHVIHVDARFTAEERAGIQAAADSWAVRSVGAEPIDFVWGARVDVTDTGRRVLVRASSRTAAMVDDNARLAGTVAVTQMLPGAERILLLMDRIGEKDRASFQAIVAHELGHHYGIHHENVPSGCLMSYEQVGEIPSRADADALPLSSR